MFNRTNDLLINQQKRLSAVGDEYLMSDIKKC